VLISGAKVWCEACKLVGSLTDQSYDDPTKIVPWLAESWEINKDASSYVFHLRKDVTFSDGQLFNAQAGRDLRLGRHRRPQPDPL
jgi:peptide/nickel transport system substrate-binding protein